MAFGYFAVFSTPTGNHAFGSYDSNATAVEIALRLFRGESKTLQDCDRLTLAFVNTTINEAGNSAIACAGQFGLAVRR